ncbi:type I glutamate--ammonia ligase [Hydrogenimonas sp. SS33]|uniref:type I glutamate--ammonia ligase n=1 Tax=Hydrogenimonas leucolamina TaxID=2954236 RepID=UPI00336C26BC
MSAVDKFFQLCKDNDVEFVDFRFTDIFGRWHHVAYNFNAVEASMFENGIPFDGSSIRMWKTIDQSDTLLMPDAESVFLDPFTADPTAVVICSVHDVDGTPYNKDPRTIAKKALEYVEKEGIADAAYFGPENEFFIFDHIHVIDEMNAQGYEIDSEEGAWNMKKDPRDEGGYNIGHRPQPKEGYFPVPPVDSQMDIRAEMVKVLEEVGIETFVVHHEVGTAGQGEIGVKFGTIISAADNVQKYKYVCKNVAHLNGKTLTFMPKPLYNDNGNGMHPHMSLWKDGKNLFFKEGEYGNISETAKYFIGGIIEHSAAVAAFTNPSTNSYKRLMPGFEAPSVLAYSARNRSACFRIPFGAGEKSVRVEFRSPDSTACPYLAFAVMMLAGIDGIKRKLDPGAPRDEDLFEYTLEELRDKGIKTMPATLREALEGLKNDHAFLTETGIFTEEFIQEYIDWKYEVEVNPVEGRPHPYEFNLYYSC